MKAFKDLSQIEITNLSKEEFMSVSPFDKHSCHDCRNQKAALSWWCTSKEAIEFRGTSIPGGIKCKFWSPDWSRIEDKYKTIENGFVAKKPLIKIKPDRSWFSKLFNRG